VTEEKGKSTRTGATAGQPRGIEQIIKAAIDRGASDLHVKAGDVFRARIDGKLVPLTKHRLTPEQTKAIAQHLIPSDEDRARIDRLRDYDCSWACPRGAVPREHPAAALLVHDRDASDPVRCADVRNPQTAAHPREHRLGRAGMILVTG